MLHRLSCRGSQHDASCCCGLIRTEGFSHGLLARLVDRQTAFTDTDEIQVAMFEAHSDLEIFRIRLGKALDYEFHEDYIGGYFSEKGPRDVSGELGVKVSWCKVTPRSPGYIPTFRHHKWLRNSRQRSTPCLVLPSNR
jgi:hypothetical protein